MPGHAGSPYWAAVDFESEEDDPPATPPNQRVYLDPWCDNESYGIMQADTTESSQGDNFNSFAGEPVSASFYYVPTKNYDSGEEPPLPPPRRIRTPDQVIPLEPMYARKLSKTLHPEYPDQPIYGEKPLNRRRSMFIEEPIYASHQVIYEPIYGTMVPPGYLPPLPPRGRMPIAHHPEYVMSNMAYGTQRRHSRMSDAYDYYGYESVSPDYEDWARPFPKTAPDNFHLSKYGHLQIDYSFSWNSLDRLIRNQ